MNFPTKEVSEAVESIVARLDQTPPHIRRHAVIGLIRRALTVETVLEGYRRWLTAETERLQAEINAAAENEDAAAINAAVLASRHRCAETLQSLTDQGGL